MHIQCINTVEICGQVNQKGGETGKQNEEQSCLNVYTVQLVSVHPCLWGIQKYTRFPTFFHWVQRTCAPMGLCYFILSCVIYRLGALKHSQEMTNNMLAVSHIVCHPKNHFLFISSENFKAFSDCLVIVHLNKLSFFSLKKSIFYRKRWLSHLAKALLSQCLSVLIYCT